MSIQGGSVVGTALVLVVPKTDGVEAKIQGDVKAALAKVDGKVPITADTKQAEQNVANLGRTIEQQASSSIAAKVKEREETQLLAAEYQKVAATAVAGSEEQIAASKLAAEAYQKVAASSIKGSEEQIAASKAAAEAQKALSVEQQKSGGILDSLTSKLRGVGNQNNLVSQSLNQIEQSSGGATAGLTAMGAAGGVAVAGLLAIAGAAAAGISKLVDLAGQTKVLQRTTGATAEDASRFNFVLKEVGINSDSVSASLFRFNRNIADHADKFAAAGVEVAKYNDGTTNVIGTLDNVRKRLEDIPDVTQRNAILFDLLGRGALSLAAYLKLSDEQLAHFNELAEQTGHVLNQQTLDQTRQFQFELRELGARAEDLEISLGRKALPVVTGFFEALNIGVSYAEKAAHAIGDLATSHEKGAQQSTANRIAHDALNVGLGVATGGVSYLVAGLGKLGEAHSKAAAKAQEHKDQVDKEAEAAAGLTPFMDTLRQQEDTAALSGDKLATEAAKLKGKMDDLGASVGLTGEQLLAFGGGDAKAAEDGANRVKAAMDATSSSFKSAYNVVDEFSLSKLTSEDKSAEAAIANLDKAEQNLADTREKQSAKTKLTVSDQIALRKATEDVEAAQKKVNDTSVISVALLDQQVPALDRAKEALKALLPQAFNLTDTQKQIVNFYEDSLVEATTFSANIRTAIEQGYDPGLISDLLQKGPKEAAPLLQQLVSDNTGKLKELVNAAQQAIEDQGYLARESARLTNLAINDASDQRNRDFKTAMAILQTEAASGGQATAQEIADKLGILPSEVIRIAAQTGDGFGIHLANGVIPHVEDVKTAVGTIQESVDALHGKALDINVNTGDAEARIAALQAKMDELGVHASAAQLAVDSGDITKSFPSSSGGSDSSPAPSDSGGDSGSAMQADGGILHFYASGGREVHQAFVARAGTPIRVFNEPETGGEAYIPLAQSKRDRSERVLAGVAETFGGQYVRGGAQRFDLGGTWPGPRTARQTSPGGISVSVSLNIAGGVGYSLDQLGDAVEGAVEGALVRAVSSGALGGVMESHRMSYR